MSLYFPPIHLLRKHYSRLCPERSTLQPVSGAEINSRNWFVHLNNETVPRFVLKKKTSPDKDLVDRLPVTVCEYSIAAKKNQLLPKLLSADNGQLFVFDDGAFFRLTEFREGEKFSGTTAELRACGTALAQVHLALENCTFGENSDLYTNLSEVEKSTVLKCDGKDFGPGDFGQRAIEWLECESPARYAEIELIESQSDLPRQPVHHDFMPQNLLFKDQQVVAVLDPDSLVIDFELHAIAFAASRLSPEKVPWEFLASYHSVVPLTPKELRLLPAFVRREAVRRINWIFRVNFLMGQDSWRTDFFKHLRNIEITYAWEAEFALSDQELLRKISK